MASSQASGIQQYAIVTINYWAFTLTDGALRMLVLFYFHQLGYAPLTIALLFVLYELCGVITNLVGGWLGAKWGLNTTMHIGLGLQIVALAMLAVDSSYLSVAYVMAAQAVSGVAKDLNKMSAKSSIKVLIPDDQKNTLYRWVARLTGSKNTLKGVGFFLGGLLLNTFDFRYSVSIMAVALTIVLIASLALLKSNYKSRFAPKFKDIFSKSSAINRLSAARFFLFSSRDIWFTVALPVFLQSQWQWSYTSVGTLLAIWIIIYGGIQAFAPKITAGKVSLSLSQWALYLAVGTLALAVLLSIPTMPHDRILLIGIFIFCFLFAINSSAHSYAIVALAKTEGVSLDVGFYYMANAGGRLLGLLLSGLIYQYAGLVACIFLSASFVVTASIISRKVYVAQH